MISLSMYDFWTLERSDQAMALVLLEDVVKGNGGFLTTVEAKSRIEELNLLEIEDDELEVFRLSLIMRLTGEGDIN